MNFVIVLYYKYVPIADPKTLAMEEREICERLSLKGRIIVSEEGINGTLEGTKENIEKYCVNLSSYPEFKDIVFKKSNGNGNSFPKLKVKVRREIVSSHLGEEDVKPWETTGIALTADELQSWIDSGKDFEIVDMRNDYEYKVGHFENSINPELGNFRDLRSCVNKLEALREKTVLAVCTGGVRCEKASGYLIKKGFKNVYQLQDGIVTYIEKYPNKAFKGKLYVFDGRIGMDFDKAGEHTVVGKCDLCGESTENYVNCKNPQCNAHFLTCKKCQEEKDGFCSDVCRNLIIQNSKISLDFSIKM